MSNLDRMSAEQYLVKKSRKRVWQKIVVALACVVVFCTTYALILPALTQERPVFCGMEEHTHTEACVPQKNEIQQVCVPQAHVHTDDCRNESGELVCGLADYLAHMHTESCRREDGTLVCTLEEHPHHVHTDACWETVETVIPQVLHRHSEECMGTEQGELSCGMEEDEAHTHETACYTQIPVYLCGWEEGDVVSEEIVTEEKVLTCTEPETQEHVHTESCFQAVAELLPCEKVEHTHTLACYADPSADVETREIWEQSFAEVQWSGNWAEDVLAIARTQLGYQESTRNYVVLEDGVSVRGYSRYGAWYQDPYGDWCAMFAAFCLHYAGVQNMPLDSNCPNWVEQLKAADLYQPQSSYVPETGDLIFFDWDESNSPDHVGIVEQIAAGEDGILQITVIEGNRGNRVRTEAYTMNDQTILGYGTLPVQLTQEERLQVEELEARIDALPTLEEINAGMEQAEAGESTWLEEVFRQVAEVYAAWNQLGDAQKQEVSNAETLMSLEAIWGSETLMAEISSTAPTMASYTSTRDFIDLNLYDYNGKINDLWKGDKNYPGFQWNGGAYTDGKMDRHDVEFIDFGNSKITDYDYRGRDNGVSDTAVKVGVLYTSNSETGAINRLWWENRNSSSITNRPVGYSTNTEALNRLLQNNYPALIDGTSLSYLFTKGEAVTKLNTQSIDGLFQQDPDTGAYSYNSRENHAQFDQESDFFQLYDQILTPNFILYPFGNFLPLNSISDLSQATQVGKLNTLGGMKNYVEKTINGLGLDSTDTQLKAMLQKYQREWEDKWSTVTASEAIADFFTGEGPTKELGFLTREHLNRMYNIDWNVDTNFFFGMDMSMTFMQPKGGMTGKNDEYPMVFSFTGDDDVWVYVDDVLFLDLTGIHRHVGGEIDFVKGEVRYYELDLASGDVSKNPYQTFTFKELLEAAGKDASGLQNGTFANYSVHSFRFFYMERGSGSSVCRMNFNFPLLQKNTVTVKKENTSLDGGTLGESVLGNPDYYFNIMAYDGKTLFVGPGSVTGIGTYKVMDADGNILKNEDQTDQIFQVDQYGIFTLKAGQSAVFSGLPENDGKYYVQELIKAPDNGQYPTVLVNDQESGYNNLIQWNEREYYQSSGTDPTVGPDGYRWYGRNGPVTDVSSNHAFYFKQQNRLDTEKLGSLSITKKMEEATPGRAFQMEVLLDGEKLPVGTPYTVNGAQKTVETAGVILLEPDQTAEISNIISGTVFSVRELDGADYTVTYEAEHADEVQQDGAHIQGVVRTGVKVSVTVTNTVQGASVEIPVTKQFAASGGADTTHSYHFKLCQVEDATGEKLAENGTVQELTAAFTGDTWNDGKFVLSYLRHEIPILPVTLYYRITEEEAADALPNRQQFIAEIRLSEKDGTLSAELVQLHGATDQKTAAFVNTLVGELHLKKNVVGSIEAQNQKFRFQITLDPGTSGLTTLPEVQVKIGEDTESLPDDGVITLSHGETAVLSGIPVGVHWTVTELGAQEYAVTVAVQGTVTDSGQAGGVITPGSTEVVYTNTQLYTLPETGGTGTMLYTLTGLAICGGACLLYLMKKHRKGAF